MPRYIFEKGWYPDNVVIDDVNLSNHDSAVEQAKRLGADAVYMGSQYGDARPFLVWGREAPLRTLEERLDEYLWILNRGLVEKAQQCNTVLMRIEADLRGMPHVPGWGFR